MELTHDGTVRVKPAISASGSCIGGILIRGIALRSEVAAFQNGESDNILDFVSVDEYRKMEDELKKAYQYFEWNDRSGAYRYYEEIQKKVAAQVKDWKAINPRAEITSVRIMLFST